MAIEAKSRIFTDALHNHIYGWEWLRCHNDKFKIHTGARTNSIYGRNACVVELIWYELTNTDACGISSTSLKHSHQRRIATRVHSKFKVQKFSRTVVFWDVPRDIDTGTRLVGLTRSDRGRGDTWVGGREGGRRKRESDKCDREKVGKGGGGRWGGLQTPHHYVC